LDTLLFAMRALHFAATISTGGVIVFRQAVVASSFADAGFERSLRRILALSIVIVVASGIGWFAVTAADIAGQPIKDIFAVRWRARCCSIRNSDKYRCCN
jgi:putative copper export protein